jgi:cell pole-organizing protein PopZ
MSFSSNDIYNTGGPGSSAEPSMEEILASIRRILKEDDTAKPAAPVEMDEDVLILDRGMITRPAEPGNAGNLGNLGTATEMPTEPPPPEPAPAALQYTAEPLHFASEPTPLTQDFIATAPPEPLPAPPPEPAPEPAPAPVSAEPRMFEPQFVQPLPVQPQFIQPQFIQPQIVQPQIVQPQFVQPQFGVAPAPAAQLVQPPIVEPPAPEPWVPAPTPQMEAKMPEQNNPPNFEPPHGLLSDTATDAAASSIGALVRSMSVEKSVTVSRHGGLTIEDIVREEIKPLLKAWLDTHLPSLVERVVRSEIERVIDRSGT